ncbi:MAG: HNH endonuclease [Candidatus Eisenbacteria bacterium]|nr:HNH endonuclease [Candidatus Eisenbacteria bacterium]
MHQALTTLHRAEQSAVLWFSEMNQRKLYRDLGYSSIHQYAAESLGFSRSKIFHFLRLADDLERLPQLRAAIAKNEIGWTKAQEVAKVASPATEERWIDVAKNSNRRTLEKRVDLARRRSALKRRAHPRQGELSAHPTDQKCPTDKGNLPASDRKLVAPDNYMEIILNDDPELVDDAPVSVEFRFTPIQLARYETLIEKIHKSRLVEPGISREEILLHSLEQFLDPIHEPLSDPIREPLSDPIHEPLSDPIREPLSDPIREPLSDPTPNAGVAISDGVSMKGDEQRNETRNNQDDRAPAESKKSRRRDSATPYKIVIYKCDTCQQAILQTNRGMKKLNPSVAEAAACDAIIEQQGQRNRSTISPTVRRTVLNRDKHKCQAPGCRNTRFLEVHHRKPRKDGGSNNPGNLVTLCSSCHQLWHEKNLDPHLLS